MPNRSFTLEGSALAHLRCSVVSPGASRHSRDHKGSVCPGAHLHGRQYPIDDGVRSRQRYNRVNRKVRVSVFVYVALNSTIRPSR